MKKRNIILAVSYILFAVAGFLYTLSWPYVSTTGVNPSFWPLVLFAIMFITAVCILIVEVRKPADESKNGKKFNLCRSLPTIIWVGLYILAFQNFGFLIPTIIFLMGEMYLFGEKRWISLLGISILLPVVLYYLFTKVFGIYLP